MDIGLPAAPSNLRLHATQPLDEAPDTMVGHVSELDQALLMKPAIPREKKKTGRPRKIRKRPKKAISAYTNFVMRNRRSLMEENPELSFQEVAKKLGAIWRSLADKDKEDYVKEALKDKARYEREKKTWKAPPPVTKRKKPKGAPKNPLSAYTLFVVETRRQVSEAHPHLSFGEIAVLVGEKWRNLGDDQKMKYLVQAEQEKTRYEREMEKWNAKCKEEAEMAMRNAKRKKKKRNGPKNPKSAYTFFVMDTRKEVSRRFPEKTFGEVARHVAEMWRALPREDRIEYEARARQDRSRWEREKLQTI